MNFSFWEKEYFVTSKSTIIIGSGIVGMSTAISLKEASPTSNIIIIDRQWPPQGASTKNAGFVCFGSFSEIISDLKTLSTEECIELIKMRWEGIKILRGRLQEDTIKNTGGYELFDKGKIPKKEDINNVNRLFEKATGIKNYLKKVPNKYFPKFDPFMISMPAEGMLNPMEMMNQLRQKCLELGIKIISGIHISTIDSQNKKVITSTNQDIPFEKCVVCTNGFALQLLPNLSLTAVRNQVVMTNPLPNLDWKGVYHYDEGYYYFRNYGDRVLLGGARNYDAEAETTDQFGPNDKINAHLHDFLSENVISTMNYTIDTEWSGILGVGPSKLPILEQINSHLYVGVRLGGMGVAIGSYLGEKLAKMISS